MIKNINTENAPKAIGPYSQAVISGNMVYVSGQLPIDPKTSEMPSDIKAQTKQSLENIKAILKEAGVDMSAVVRCGIFVKDMNDFVSVNEVYGTFFSEPFPSRATVEVARLPKDALVEIDAIAQLS